jgi:hypothetical protein
VARVAHRGEEPAVDIVLGFQVVQAAAGGVDRHRLDDLFERRHGEQTDRAPDAVSHADEVGLVGELALLDDRMHVGVAGDEAQLAAGRALVDPHAQQAGADPFAATGRAPGARCFTALERRIDVGGHQRLVDRHDHHVVVARALELGRIAQAAVRLPVVDAGRHPVDELEPEERQWVLLHALAYRQSRGVALWADARAEQDRRRVDGARTEHDTVSPHLGPLVVDADPYASGPAVVEEHAVDRGRADDAQVRAVPGRLEIAVVAAHPRAATCADAVGRHASAIGRVVVVTPGVPESEASVTEGAVNRAPLVLREPHDRDGPAATVVFVVAEIGVILHPAQIGQQVLVRPARAAGCRPSVVVTGHGADRDHAVDRRGAAEPSAPEVRASFLRDGSARFDALPLERQAGPLVQRAPTVHAPQLGGCCVRPPIGTGLEQHHPDRGVLGQACGHHRSSRSAANDDPVGFRQVHGRPPLRSTLRGGMVRSATGPRVAPAAASPRTLWHAIRHDH